MGAALLLDKMSTEEKIQTMESLWDDLCKKASNISSPIWHEKVLRDREYAVNNGTEEIIDWQTAKKQIQESIK